MTYSPWYALDLLSRYRPGDWIRDAGCAGADDPDIFFPSKNASPRAALAYCRACPVQVECADYASNSPVELGGIWGGINPNKRREARARKRA